MNDSLPTSELLKLSLRATHEGGDGDCEEMAMELHQGLKGGLGAEEERVYAALRKVEGQTQWWGVEKSFITNYAVELESCMEEELTGEELTIAWAILNNNGVFRDGAGSNKEYLQNYVSAVFGTEPVSRHALAASIRQDRGCERVLSRPDTPEARALNALLTKMCVNVTKTVTAREWFTAFQKQYHYHHSEGPKSPRRASPMRGASSPHEGLVSKVFLLERQIAQMQGTHSVTGTPSPAHVAETPTRHVPETPPPNASCILPETPPPNATNMSSILPETPPNAESFVATPVFPTEASPVTPNPATQPRVPQPEPPTDVLELAEAIERQIVMCHEHTLLTTKTPVSQALPDVQQLLAEYATLKARYNDLLAANGELQQQRDGYMGEGGEFKMKFGELQAVEGDLRKQLEESLRDIDELNAAIAAREAELREQALLSDGALEREDALKVHVRMAEERCATAEAERDHLREFKDSIRKDAEAEWEDKVKSSEALAAATQEANSNLCVELFGLIQSSETCIREEAEELRLQTLQLLYVQLQRDTERDLRVAETSKLHKDLQDADKRFKKYEEDERARLEKIQEEAAQRIAQLDEDHFKSLQKRDDEAARRQARFEEDASRKRMQADEDAANRLARAEQEAANKMQLIEQEHRNKLARLEDEYAQRQQRTEAEVTAAIARAEADAETKRLKRERELAALEEDHNMRCSQLQRERDQVALERDDLAAKLQMRPQQGALQELEAQHQRALREQENKHNAAQHEQEQALLAMQSDHQLKEAALGSELAMYKQQLEEQAAQRQATDRVVEESGILLNSLQEQNDVLATANKQLTEENQTLARAPGQEEIDEAKAEAERIRAAMEELGRETERKEAEAAVREKAAAQLEQELLAKEHEALRKEAEAARKEEEAIRREEEAVKQQQVSAEESARKEAELAEKAAELNKKLSDAEEELQKARDARPVDDRLMEQLRAEANAEKERADAERQRAEEERLRAEEERMKAREEQQKAKDAMDKAEEEREMAAQAKRKAEEEKQRMSEQAEEDKKRMAEEQKQREIEETRAAEEAAKRKKASKERARLAEENEKLREELASKDDKNSYELEQQLREKARRNTELEELLESETRERDEVIAQLQEQIERQNTELALLRQQIKDIHSEQHRQRSLQDINRSQDDDRFTIEAQEVRGRKYLERHWRRIEMPFGAEGSLQIRVRGPSKTDPEPPVVVSECVKNGAAHKAGLQAGWLVVKVRNPIGTWPIVTRRDFLHAIGPNGHVFENVELSIFVVQDEKFITEWKRKLLEYVKNEERQKVSGSWMGKMRGKTPKSTGFSGIRLKITPPAHLVKEYKVKMDKLSDEAKRNRIKHLKQMGCIKFDEEFNAENVFAMQSNPPMWRTLALTACDQCNINGSREMIPRSLAYPITRTLGALLGTPPPPQEMTDEAFSIVDLESRGEVDFEELTTFTRELYMDLIFRDDVIYNDM
eukprot:TRINITY_DN4136_c0_g3_i1.p1 TRINITY_DN4136_c0_g3~~TRINITY_DN4136_c0_g3_i1.p1  ORF type:complete len:1470 (+),score=480.36 TRINITY_DN4136_c0_g3_i1:37-4446(+)